MPEFRIESLDDPRLDVFRSLKRTNQNRRQDAFVAEGVTVVERLLQSEFEVLSVVVTEPKIESFRAKIPEGITVYQVTRELASELVGYTFHMGVLAAGRRQSPVSLDAVLPATGPSLVFVADRVIDQQNMGLLVRIAAGFGADALLVTEGSADPLSRRSVRVSMGNSFLLPIVECTGPSGVQELERLGYCSCTAVLSETAEELSSFSFSKRTAIVFGNETHGVSEAIVAKCEHQLTISMFNGTDSLNVAISAGIFGYAYRTLFPNVKSE